MIDLRASLLVAGCFAFVAIVGAELLVDDAPAPPILAAASRADVPPPPAPPREAAERLVAASLARPLFSPDRRPAAAASAPTADYFSDKRLTAIVVEPDRKFAIFAVAGNKPLTLGEGDEVNGWKVDAITPREVSLSGPDGTRTIQPKPDRGSAETRPANMPAPAAPPAGPRPPTRALPVVQPTTVTGPVPPPPPAR